MYKVYILESLKDHSKYIGVTQDLINRLREHNSGETKTTKVKAPYKLVWYGGFLNKYKAYAFEKYLKSSSGFAFRNKRLI
jgi:predicted GIY-YIG superfamily endonuclease